MAMGWEYLEELEDNRMILLIDSMLDFNMQCLDYEQFSKEIKKIKRCKYCRL